jgi:hypothetical protein
MLERFTWRRLRLRRAVLEQVFQWGRTQRRMERLHTAGVRRVVFADLGKNVYAYWRGAEAAGIQVLAIGDDRFGWPGREYRGVAIVPVEQALREAADAVVVSNASYVHAARRELDVKARTPLPVYNWTAMPVGHAPRARIRATTV